MNPEVALQRRLAKLNPSWLDWLPLGALLKKHPTALQVAQVRKQLAEEAVHAALLVVVEARAEAVKQTTIIDHLKESHGH